MKTMTRKLVWVGLLSALTLNTYNAYAEWQCYASDKGGHLWMSTGMTQDHANTVAYNFCTAYSPNSDTCHISNCTEK